MRIIQIIAASNSVTLPEGVVLGDRAVQFDGAEVSTPTDIKTFLRGKTGEAQMLLRRDGEEKTVTIQYKPEPKKLDRQYVLADGALIAQDVYPERWPMENFFHVHSVRSGSYAEQSGWLRYSLIMSIDGVRPLTLEHLRKLLD